MLRDGAVQSLFLGPHAVACALHPARVMTTIQQLLEEANSRGASDLHLSAGEPPAVRVHGDLSRLEGTPLAPAQVLELIHSIMTDAQRDHFAEQHECDFAADLQGIGRYRVNAFVHSRGPGA